MISAVILAGGMGTRMGLQTKALIDVEGAPFVQRQLTHLVDAGFDDVVILSHGSAIKGRIGGGSVRADLQVEHVNDGQVRRGTGGAVLHALVALPPEFIVLNGDSYGDLDYEEMVRLYRMSRKAGMMAVYGQQLGHEAANVQYHYGLVMDYSKERHHAYMHHVDFGAFITSRHQFNRFWFEHSALTQAAADDPFDLGVIYRGMIRAGELGGFETHSAPHEIGSPAGLARYRAHIKGGGK